MDWERRCMRFCAGMLTLAVLLRLWAGGVLIPVGQALGSEQAASFFLYLHTGRVVRTLPEGPEPEPMAESCFTAASLEHCIPCQWKR